MVTAIGRWCFDHRGKTILGWFVALGVVFGAAGALGPAFSATSGVPSSDSADGIAVLDEYFPHLGAGGTSGTIVFRADQGIDDPDVVAAMEALFARVNAGFPDSTGVAEHPGATVVSPYSEQGQGQIAHQGNLAGRLAFATVNLSADVDDTAAGLIGEAIMQNAPDIDGLEVLAGGQYLAVVEPPQTELIGVAFAVVVLILAFGSVLAMGLPIAVAVGGVGAGIGLATVAGHLLDVPDFSTMLGMMIGLGVGIDYALFIVTRYREALHRGCAPRVAVAEAMGSAGRAVIFAGFTVVISMLGLLLIGIGWVGGMGIAISLTVGTTMLSSITLLPALLGLAGERVEITRWRGLIAAGFAAIALLGLGIAVPALAIAGAAGVVSILLMSFAVQGLRRLVPARRAKPIRETLAYRWSRAIQRRPVVAALGATVALLALAAPVLDLKLGWTDESNFPAGSHTREAYELMAAGFGDGFNGPLVVTALPRAGATPFEAAETVAALQEALSSTDGVAAVGPTMADDPDDPQAWLLTVIPTTSPQDDATVDLVRELRDSVIPATVGTFGTSAELEVNITGLVATNIDITDYLARRTPLFFGGVLTLSFLLLMMVFRSVLVPIKAVVMNVLSIAAAYGAVTAVFQWGWGGTVLGIEGGPINPFIPMMMFAIVFGLSMDYEVFMLSRIREEYDRTGDAVTSVADGLANTARVITAAAAIMVVVFGSFMFEDLREVKLMGLGLALAVLLDATLVRMLLVPATMELLGARNWWMPAWLDRLLPDLHVEGGRPHPDRGLPTEPALAPADVGQYPPARPSAEPVGEGSRSRNAIVVRMVATDQLASRKHFDPQGHRMGPLGTLAAQGAVVLGVLWVFGAFGELLLPPSVGLLALFPVLGAMLLAPKSVLVQLPVSFSILGIVALPVASLAWSIDPAATFVNVRSFIPSIVAIILAAGLLTLRDFTLAMLWAIRIAVVVTIIALILVPSTRYHLIGGINDDPYPGWHGFFNHKNNMAPFMAISIPTVLIFDRNPLFKWGTLALMAGLLAGSTSATGVSGAFIAVIAWYWLKTYQKQDDERDSTLLFMVSLVGSLALIGGAIASFATITSAYGKDTSLSGRTDIWEASIEALTRRPWLGHGFGSLFWRVDLSPETAEIWRHVGFEASHAHNGALDLALQIGLVGLLVFTVLWLSIVSSAWSKLDSSPDLAIWILAIMASNFVIGLSEDVFFGGWIALFCAMKVLLMRRDSSLLQPSWRDGIAKWT